MNENKENQNNSKIDEIEKAVIFQILRHIEEEINDLKIILK